jgi:polysaccharide chain length determinant protein (PEP-CTERM system associated)
VTTFSIVGLATTAVLSFIPDYYRSDATLVVVQQQIPERYVTPTTTTTIVETLQAIREEVLSRTRLLAIIDEFGLYSKERRRLGPESLVAMIRKNIDIIPIASQDPSRHDLSAFQLSFIAESPRVAQQVTSRLTTLFIEENLTTRERQADITTKFLKQRQESARQGLAAQEERLRDFKMKYLGELPEQQQGNLAILNGLQAQLQSTTAGLDRARQQGVYLESLLHGYQSLQHRSTVTVIPGVPATNPMEAIHVELARLKSLREDLLARYTAQHPEVIEVNQKIFQAEALLKRVAAAQESAEAVQSVQPASPEDTTAKTFDPQVDAASSQLKSQIVANKIEIENLLKEQKRLESSIAEYQNRLNLTPVREQQLADIMRDEEILKKEYSELLSKEMQSQLAGSLEKEQAGQQFRLVDQPSLPTVPVSPKRVPIIAAGALGGLALGMVLALLLDLRRGLVHTEDDLHGRFTLPLIVAVPILPTPVERRRKVWLKSCEWAAGSAVVIAVVCIEVYNMIKATSWLAERILR